MKHTIILSIALFATAAHADDHDIANIGCEGKSEVTVSGRIDQITTKGKPPVHTDVATPAAPVAIADAAAPLAPPKSMISDDALLGMPATSTVGDAKNAGANAAPGWDFKAGCVDYTQKFWSWRISKCKSVDATWVSPGEGKYLPGKEPKQ